MGIRADAELHVSLSKIIDSLEKAADANLAFPPSLVRDMAKALTIVRDSHKSLAEYEALMRGEIAKGLELANVVPIRPETAA